MVFDENITLKNKKIIIPKGKGFIPGGKINSDKIFGRVIDLATKELKINNGIAIFTMTFLMR